MRLRGCIDKLVKWDRQGTSWEDGIWRAWKKQAHLCDIYQDHTNSTFELMRWLSLQKTRIAMDRLDTLASSLAACEDVLKVQPFHQNRVFSLFL